jgi:hypothetical protein
MEKVTMKKLFAVLPLAVCATVASAAHHDDTLAHWNSIVGVITAQGVNNPIGPAGNIDSGTFAWSTRNGHATVNLSTGAAYFQVDGLVINGTVFSGTPGPVSAVTGTLVCNPGDAAQTVLDTSAVPLSAQGDAQFAGQIAGVPADCTNPLFLIRINTPAGAAGRWIATGAERVVDDGSN